MARETDEATMERKILVGHALEPSDTGFIRVELDYKFIKLAMQLKQFKFVNPANHL